MSTIGGIGAPGLAETESQRLFRLGVLPELTEIEKEGKRLAQMSSKDKLDMDSFVRDFNIQLNPTRQPQQSLGQNDFLRLLLEQLKYQDPTSPMEDKQFIAQMAQFSTLEQMTSMAGDFSKLTSMLLGSEASTSLGKGVEISEGENTIQGIVQAVTRDPVPQILVNGNFYSWEKVTKVFNIENEKE